MNQSLHRSLLGKLLASLFLGICILTPAPGITATAFQETETQESPAEAESADVEGASESETQAEKEAPQSNEENGTSESPDEALTNDSLLKNGSLEESESGKPKHWIFPSAHQDKGFEFKLDEEDAFDGSVSGMLDSTNADTSGNTSFTMLNQRIDPEVLRGKRVRFRAAVRTADTDLGGKAQLWFRVDRMTEDGERKMGAFDNMGDRPITDGSWKHYEIVADVDEDASQLTVGMLLIGQAKAWIDDASLEIIPEEELDQVKVTGRSMAAASETPPQPFFNGWLWLAGFAIALMILSQQSNSFAQRFALRFAMVYWLLYSFPTLLSGVVGSVVKILALCKVPVEDVSKWLMNVTTRHKEYTEQAVHWTASNVFGIEGQLILPNGSGDTTFAFIRIFICCVVALAVASIWTGIYWRKADSTWLRDILRTYLRYVLALTMLSYGLHKTGFNMTQFAMDSMPRDGQLDRTFGEASPMGLLWTFMAASPAYTFFAGLGEVVGALLLIFRRTATLGAFVVFGVMTNVMMLNFCYDVPVKQYSFHLVMMALIIALPEIPRMFKLLVLNEPTQPSNLMTPPYTNRITIWIHRLIKTVVIACAFAWPVGEQVFKEVKFYQTDSERQRQEKAESEHLLINRGFRWINEYPYNR